MRIDLEHGGRRPWYLELVLAIAGRFIGIKPGPPLLMTYRPEFMGAELRGYILRGISRSGPWSKGEAELFAAFVSDLNTCHF